MLETYQIFISLFSVLSLLAICFITSFLIKFLFSKGTNSNRYISPFWSLFLSAFFWVSIYAIFKTKALTILFPIPFLVLFVFKEILKNSTPPTIKEQRNEWLFLGVALLLQFSFFLFTLTSFDTETVKYIAGDFSIYYRMVDRLNTFGIEAYNFNIDIDPNILPSPYHYGDLWLYAAVARFVSLNPSITFLVSFTLLSVTFTMGLLQLIKSIFSSYLDNSKSYLFILVLSGLFAGIQICYPPFLLKFAESYTLSIFNWGKVIVLSCSLMGVMLAINSKNWTTASVAVIISGLLYINSAPAIFGAYFVLLFVVLVRKKILFKNWLGFNTIYIGITGLTVVVLYKIVPMFATKLPAVASAKTEFLAAEGFTKYLTTTINIFIGGWFQLFTILPYLIVFGLGLFLLKRKNQLPKLKELKIDNSILFLVLSFVCGLGSWAILHPLSVDTVQFFHNIIAVIYVLIISLILFFIILVVKNKVLISIILLITLFSVFTSSQNIFYAWTFNKKECKELLSFFQNEKESSPFINIKSMNELSYWSAKKTDQYIPISILSYRWHDYHNVSLNTPFISTTDASIYENEEAKDIANATFTTFYNRKIAEGTADLPTIITKFASEHKVKYITVSNDTTIPDYLLAKAIDSLRLNSTNFTIYKIK